MTAAEVIACCRELAACSEEPGMTTRRFLSPPMRDVHARLTRLMETVVHSDDLAASVRVPTPDFPDSVVGPVLDLLTGLALRRHGATALVRTLARPQRAPATVAAF